MRENHSEEKANMLSVGDNLRPEKMHAIEKVKNIEVKKTKLMLDIES